MNSFAIVVMIYELLSEADAIASLRERLTKTLHGLDELKYSKEYKAARKAFEDASKSNQPAREINSAINWFRGAYEHLSKFENKGTCALSIALCFRHLGEKELEKQFVETALKDFQKAYKKSLNPETKGCCSLYVAICYKQLQEENLKEQYIESAKNIFKLAWKEELDSIELRLLYTRVSEHSRAVDLYPDKINEAIQKQREYFREKEKFLDKIISEL